MTFVAIDILYFKSTVLSFPFSIVLSKLRCFIRRSLTRGLTPRELLSLSISLCLAQKRRWILSEMCYRITIFFSVKKRKLLLLHRRFKIVAIFPPLAVLGISSAKTRELPSMKRNRFDINFDKAFFPIPELIGADQRTEWIMEKVSLLVPFLGFFPLPFEWQMIYRWRCIVAM